MRQVIHTIIPALLFFITACNDSENSVFNHYWQNENVEVFHYAREGESQYFMRQREGSEIQMEALVIGRILIAGGCTLLEGPFDKVTVIWPVDFRMEEVNHAFRIRGNDVIIESGDSLRLSGGFYSKIPDSYCSGSFWLVGSEIEVLD